jgi:hypothetical protein
MGRHCQVCTHAAIHRINRELLGGAKLQPTAIHYGIPLTSLHRHRTQCLGLSKADTAVSAPSRLAGIKARLPKADEMSDLYGNLRDELTEIVTDARSRGQSMVAVTAIDKIRLNLDSVSRLTGLDRRNDPPQVNVNVDLGSLVDRLIAAIGTPSEDSITKLEKLIDAD